MRGVGAERVRAHGGGGAAGLTELHLSGRCETSTQLCPREPSWREGCAKSMAPQEKTLDPLRNQEPTGQLCTRHIRRNSATARKGLCPLPSARLPPSCAQTKGRRPRPRLPYKQEEARVPETESAYTEIHLGLTKLSSGLISPLP